MLSLHVDQALVRVVQQLHGGIEFGNTCLGFQYFDDRMSQDSGTQSHNIFSCKRSHNISARKTPDYKP